MKVSKDVIPMSPTRFFETFEWIRKNTSLEELNELKKTLIIDKSASDAIKKRDYYIYRTINQLAKEVLLKNGLLSDSNTFSPTCTLLKRQTEFIDKYQNASFITYTNCTIFTYIEPFRASFAYMGHGKKQYYQQWYKDIIDSFTSKILLNYNDLK
ncbi:hypothetical protein [Priestia megaterium]|uniref:hypothetical protein n=1 Tax=Priestia megaterium TaxID=1404 RepID=UPI001A94EE0D|nr:hypothetical protein [Priestia megaterium]QSX23543.1 hypothetical protein J0P05_28485 [Priestia megaterium]